jgi:hypothetical protein
MRIGVVLVLTVATAAMGQDYATRFAGLDREVTELEREGSRLQDAQLAARLTALQSGFLGLGPFVGGFRPQDHEANRALLRRSYAVLAALESRALVNPQLGRSLAGLYSGLGDFYGRPAFQPFNYRNYAGFGYARGWRLARHWYLSGPQYGFFERDIERLGVNLGVLGWFGWGAMRNFQREPSGLDAVDFGPVEDTGKRAMPLPPVDASNWPPEKKAAWEDLKPRFLAVANRIHQSGQALEGLKQRLGRQGMQVNAADLGNANQMEAFLQDASDLIQAGDFERAKLALDRASAVCSRLKGTTGI